MDIFSYFSQSKPKELEHTCQGKILKIKTFRHSRSLRIYFESIPNTVFYYEYNLPTNITVGKVVTISYTETICTDYLQLWISSIRLLDDDTQNNTYNRFHQKIKYEEKFTIGCLHCDNNMLLTDSKPCNGKIYQPFFNYPKCNKCNFIHHHNMDQPCKSMISTCKKCQTNRIYKCH
jgi:hypothetical protein